MLKKIAIWSFVSIILVVVAVIYIEKPLYEFIYFLGLFGISLFIFGILKIIGQKALEKWERTSYLMMFIIFTFLKDVFVLTGLLTVIYIVASLYANHNSSEKIDLRLGKIKWHLISMLVGIILIISSINIFPAMIVELHNNLISTGDAIETYREEYSNVELYVNNIGQVMVPSIFESEIDEYNIRFIDTKKFIIQDQYNYYELMHYGSWRIVNKESVN